MVLAHHLLQASKHAEAIDDVMGVSQHVTVGSYIKVVTGCLVENKVHDKKGEYTFESCAVGTMQKNSIY